MTRLYRLPFDSCGGNILVIRGGIMCPAVIVNDLRIEGSDDLIEIADVIAVEMGGNRVSDGGGSQLQKKQLPKSGIRANGSSSVNENRFSVVALNEG